VIFWINLPLGLLSFLVSNVQLRRLPRHERRHRLDLVGAGLVMVATATLMAAIDLGGNRFDWGSAPILGLAALSAASWVGFAVRLRTALEPLVPLGVLSNPVVIFAVLANAMGASSIMVLNLFLPIMTIEAVLTIIGLGFGTVPPMATVALQNAVERAELGAATASLNFVRSLAGTIFVGLFGALLAAKLGTGVECTPGMRQ
jgi:hypothetical protein